MIEFLIDKGINQNILNEILNLITVSENMNYETAESFIKDNEEMISNYDE